MRIRFQRRRGVTPLANVPGPVAPSPPSEGRELSAADAFKFDRSKMSGFSSLIPATPALSWRQGQRMLLPSPEGRLENSPPFQGWVWRTRSSSPEGTVEIAPRGREYEHNYDIRW